MRVTAAIPLACLLAGCSAPPPPRAPEKAKPAAPVRISHFYSSPGAIQRGESVTICYGGENARSVRVEPPVEQLKPFFNRCFQASPVKNTTYRLIAEGFDGKMVSESLSVKVVAGAVPSVRSSLIHTFAVSS